MTGAQHSVMSESTPAPMATYILGISAFYHDSAACLVQDGRIVAAAQEERFTRKKHDYGFPTKAIEYCLEEAGLTHDQLDLVAFYDKPLLKFERLLETYVAHAPFGFKLFLMGLPLWLKQKLYAPEAQEQFSKISEKIAEKHSDVIRQTASPKSFSNRKTTPE